MVSQKDEALAKIIHLGNHTIFPFSDIHGHHRALQVPEDADIVICAGDAVEDDLKDCDGVIIGSISRNAQIADEDIPGDLDILVTHYPPYGIMDEDLGSPGILNFMMKSKPAYHLFGHIHATAGQDFQFGETVCRNVCVR